MLVLKVDNVDTCNAYETAPFTVFHESMGLIDTPLEPLDGDTRVGIDGAVPIVVKAQPALKLLHPAELPALTRQ